MNSIEDILNYFIRYESEESLNNITFKENSYLNIMPKDLKDLSKIMQILKKRKIKNIESIVEKIEFKDIQKKQKVVETLKKISSVDLDLKQFFDFAAEVKKSDYKHPGNFSVDENNINRIINDNIIFVFYPILARGSGKIPLLNFQIVIEKNKLKVQEYCVQIESLRRIISEILKCDLSDLEYRMTDFYEFHKSISVFENENIFDIVELIDNEMKVKFSEFCFNGFQEYKDYQECAVTEEIILTMESFGEMILPPYREEIEEVKFHLKRDSPQLLNQYLSSCKNSISSSEVEVGLHNGSYISEYAINEKQAKIIKSKEFTRMLAVNGPPGTGKTTILKEIISDNFVKRTQLLIDVWDKDWKIIGKHNQQVYQSPLGGNCNYSMLIASSNNKAVDNIGLELLKEIDYFPNIVSSVEEQYKGILCARLGKKSNMESFKDKILDPLIKYLENYSQQNDAEVKQQIKDFHRIKNLLSDLESDISNFIINRNIFYDELMTYDITKLDITEDFISMKKQNFLEERIALQNDFYELEKDLKELNQHKESCYDDMIHKSDSLEMRKKEFKELDQTIELIKKRYNLVFFGKHLGKAKEKKYGTLEYLQNEIDHVTQECNIINDAKNYSIKKYKELEKCMADKQVLLKIKQKKISELFIFESKLKKYDLLIEDLKFLKELGLKDLTWNSTSQQMYNHLFLVNLRHELFLLSLKINENYIKKHAKEIAYNLQKMYPKNWFQAFFRNDYRYNSEYQSYLKAMWETIFICFPVVTTTLYSLNRKSFPMIKEIFDTLMIDEAGQAAIHTAIGPLFRFRKAIIVGDVFQLEPIHMYNNDIINKSKLDDQEKARFDVRYNSIQSTADRTSDVYDEIDSQRVGIVLNEHRRCERSIIAFSNKFVYKDELIITKENTQKEFLKYSLCMIDVRATESMIVKNTNISEIKVVGKIIDQLLSMYGEDYKSRIAIITPYKNQASLLKKEFPDVDSGTVHVFQGQEKEVIIFSIVTDGLSGNKSMNFIGSKANNLNVAFTRAKKQLILVGNYEACVEAKNYVSKAVATVVASGKLYSLYEKDIFKDDELEDKYKNQFLSIMSDEATNETEIDKILKKYAQHGVLVSPKAHNDFLMTIIPMIKSSLHIISPWIRASTVNDKFINSLENELKKSKMISIAFGYNKTNYDLSMIEDIVHRDNFGAGLDKDISTIKKLKDILRENLQYIPPLHSKILLIDDSLLIIGSHNWLSNNGKALNSKDEISCIIYDQSSIDYIKKRYLLD